MMTAPSSRLFLSLFAITLFLIGCGPDTIVALRHKYQLVVVLDKTNSVIYKQKKDHVQQELRSKFDRTYETATKDIQSSLLVITGNTSVFPIPSPFNTDYPNGEEESRIYQQAVTQWNSEKRKWLSERVNVMLGMIDSPCTSNTTDVFPIFSGIAQVQKNDGPWDSIVVVIFSDLVNTCRPFNMLTDITLNNAREKGKSICSDLVGRGRISATGNQNLHLTIYTPDNMENTGKVNQFWIGFFEEWGLKPNQYQFE